MDNYFDEILTMGRSTGLRINSEMKTLYGCSYISRDAIQKTYDELYPRFENKKHFSPWKYHEFRIAGNALCFTDNKHFVVVEHGTKSLRTCQHYITAVGHLTGYCWASQGAISVIQ